MDYNTAVKEKMERQKAEEKSTYEKISDAAEKSSEIFHDIVDKAALAATGYHEFKQTFYTQKSFEPKKFLWFKFNKQVGEEIIPVGLCAICDKLEIEHDA